MAVKIQKLKKNRLNSVIAVIQRSSELKQQLNRFKSNS